MPKTIDYTGRRVGRWSIIDRVQEPGTSPKWNAVCDCGTKRILTSDNLRVCLSRGIGSCGCANSEGASKRFRKHGAKKTREYGIWSGMRNRCNNPSNKDYRYYGGKGVKVCERWADFTKFLEDMGPCPFDKATIDRKDSNGNYEPDNCRWTDMFTQNNNTSKNVYIEFNGKKQAVSSWARERHIRQQTLWNRLFKYDWPVWKALGFESDVTLP